jgi:hypothetical protein
MRRFKIIGIRATGLPGFIPSGFAGTRSGGRANRCGFQKSKCSRKIGKTCSKARKISSNKAANKNRKSTIYGGQIKNDHHIKDFY